MTESDAFLAAIADRPDDDLPRLVYADWLDEHDQPERAEFIRTQIELARIGLDHPRQDDLSARAKHLFGEHRDQWRLPQFPDQYQVFRRGFVERVETTGAWLLAHPHSLPAAPMVRELKVVNAASAGMRLAELPGLERIEHLDLTNTHQGPQFHIPTFLTAARLDRLRRLTLGTCGFWPWAVPQLGEVPVLRQLDRLDLWGNPFGDDWLAALAGRPNLANLTALDLSAHEQPSINCVSDEGAAVLAASETLTRLRTLDLTDHYIGDDGFITLVNSPIARPLEQLAVGYNEIGGGERWVEALVDSPHLGNLKELAFSGNRLTTTAVEVLAAWPHLERMRVVDLRECEFGEFTRVVRERLMSSPWAGKFLL